MNTRYFAVVNDKGEVYYRPGHGLAIFEDDSSATAYAKACHAGRVIELVDHADRVIELVEKPKRKAAKRGRKMFGEAAAVKPATQSDPDTLRKYLEEFSRYREGVALVWLQAAVAELCRGALEGKP